MKVSDLIAELQKYPEDMEVTIQDRLYDNLNEHGVSVASAFLSDDRKEYVYVDEAESRPTYTHPIVVLHQ